MVGDVSDVRRKERLVLVVDVDGDVGPPEKGLHEGCAIEKPDFCLHERLARMETYPDHTFHPVHRFVLTQPDRLASVGVRFDVVVHWHESRGTMVLRPVELHPTRDPGSEQADESWFDHVLPVEKS